MKTSQTTFLTELEKSLLSDLDNVKHFQTLSEDNLTIRRYEGSWNILECMYHLNLYGEFYIPHFQRLVKLSPPLKNNNYNSGWLGNYFANSMKIKEGKKLNKMPTLIDKNPIGLPLNKNILKTRVTQITELLGILNQAKSIDLEKKRCPITLTKWITIQLGDALHFIINHENRHNHQAMKIMNYIENFKDNNTI